MLELTYIVGYTDSVKLLLIALLFEHTKKFNFYERSIQN